MKPKGEKPAKEAAKAEAKPEEAKRVTFGIDKNADFNEWYNSIVRKAELCDLRYNVKGFVVFQYWSVAAMKQMYNILEAILERKRHKPYWFPALIPEKNFNLEKEHVAGFAPEVFWVTEHGAGEKLEEKLALRPTSETAIYQMFSIWLRSYKDLPFKTYNRCQVWRYESKATRPFLRSREFHWIECHDAFANEEDARQQVREDMQITKEFLLDELGLPFIFFERPQWDKFAGAVNTYAADQFLPNGRLLQQPSTHYLGTNFSKPFNVKYLDANGKEQYCHLTCYGPAISRIFAGIVIAHGDSKGLRFPFNIAPLQAIIVPILFGKNDEAVLKYAESVRESLAGKFRVDIDLGEGKPGEKFYFWEMKGVPCHIEVGPKEAEEKTLTVVWRDNGKKEKVKLGEINRFLEEGGKALSQRLKVQALESFKGMIGEAKSLEEAKNLIEGGKVVKVNFCAIDKSGEKCAEAIEKGFGAKVRGKRMDIEEKPAGNCIVCGAKAETVVYIGREY
ncbi:MAG: proline--tRNA ligase [archaeon]